ncbi:hypothetical protein RKD30_000015 [Streptomyces pristinaespiralis]
MITRGRFEHHLGKIAPLTPLDERRKAFRLLIAVLAIAVDDDANASAPTVWALVAQAVRR